MNVFSLLLPFLSIIFKDYIYIIDNGLIKMRRELKRSIDLVFF